MCCRECAVTSRLLTPNSCAEGARKGGDLFYKPREHVKLGAQIPLEAGFSREELLKGRQEDIFVRSWSTVCQEMDPPV